MSNLLHHPVTSNGLTLSLLSHHPVIQKEVDEILVKIANEPFTSGAGFYPNSYVVPKHTAGLPSMLNLT